VNLDEEAFLKSVEVYGKSGLGIGVSRRVCCIYEVKQLIIKVGSIIRKECYPTDF
jgi:hypothetical protein